MRSAGQAVAAAPGKQSAADIGAQAPDQMLILGVSDISVLPLRFAALLSRTTSPLLVVCQP